MAAAGGDGAHAAALSATGLKLYRVRKTVAQMLKKRGYNVSELDLAMDKTVFIERFGVEPARESAGFLVAKMEDASDRLMVFFPEGDVSVKKCKDFMQRLKDEGVSHGILVVSGKFSTLARNSLMDDVKSFHIEHFRDEELLVDITEHELVPLHQPLSDDEKRALLERYKLHETQLPRIQPVDPVARFYGLQRGQVVKIIRPSETAGRYVSYRIVL